jgi:hypothetical protein
MFEEDMYLVLKVYVRVFRQLKMRLHIAPRDCSNSSACRETYRYFSCSEERGEHLILPPRVFSPTHNRQNRNVRKLYMSYTNMHFFM